METADISADEHDKRGEKRRGNAWERRLRQNRLVANITATFYVCGGGLLRGHSDGGVEVAEGVRQGFHRQTPALSDPKKGENQANARRRNRPSGPEWLRLSHRKRKHVGYRFEKIGKNGGKESHPRWG